MTSDLDRADGSTFHLPLTPLASHLVLDEMAEFHAAHGPWWSGSRRVVTRMQPLHRHVIVEDWPSEKKNRLASHIDRWHTVLDHTNV